MRKVSGSGSFVDSEPFLLLSGGSRNPYAAEFLKISGKRRNSYEHDTDKDSRQQAIKGQIQDPLSRGGGNALRGGDGYYGV